MAQWKRPHKQQENRKKTISLPSVLRSRTGLTNPRRHSTSPTALCLQQTTFHVSQYLYSYNIVETTTYRLRIGRCNQPVGIEDTVERNSIKNEVELAHPCDSNATWHCRI